MWTSGQQVILSYDSNSAAGHPELWPGLPYWWANERTADGVVRYLECKKAQGRPGSYIHTVTLLLLTIRFFLLSG